MSWTVHSCATTQPEPSAYDSTVYPCPPGTTADRLEPAEPAEAAEGGPPGVRPAAAATAGADTDTGTDEAPAPQAAAPQPAATPQAATISSALHRIVRWRNGSRHAPLHEPRA